MMLMMTLTHLGKLRQLLKEATYGAKSDLAVTARVANINQIE
jgi:hypothetical protein